MIYEIIEILPYVTIILNILILLVMIQTIKISRVIQFKTIELFIRFEKSLNEIIDDLKDEEEKGDG